MSRTYKDRPQWVRAYDDSSKSNPIHHDHYMHHLGVCTVYHDPSNRGEYDQLFCYKQTDEISWYDKPYAGASRYLYAKPTRQRENGELLKARKSFNSGNTIEDFDFANYQNRRNGASYK